ncbi:MAG: adenosylhomocysteinase [Candidatus ainarchaeum sp.]|nr:adenosylhomocysteinase [Candidatus ainarchaeum sp.]
MDCKIRDASLSAQGKLNVDWAEKRMPVLSVVAEEFSGTKPFSGLRIGACLHVTKETAVLMRALKAGGAQLWLCGSNPLSTQDDVAAELVSEGVGVFAWRGQSAEEYAWCIGKVLDAKPDIVLDDGADLTVEAHARGLKPLGGTEETTTGVLRLAALEREGKLGFPLIAVNDAKTKMMFDNRYGTGQSTIEGIIRATSVLLAGKKFVVAGYGWCGKGAAMRAKGLGASVVVTEVDPVKALEAAMDGFEVMRMDDAAKTGDVFVTVTGDRDVIVGRHFEAMKDGAILANSGHFDVEVDVKGLKALAKSVRRVRPCVDEYEMMDGRRLCLLGEGRLVNLACAEGHPSEVMQMSFANQALCAEFIAKARGRLPARLSKVPEEIDARVAALALRAMGRQIDALTPEQEAYLKSWA